MIFSLINVWLTLGTFLCSQRPFLPKPNHHLTTYHIPVKTLFDSINTYGDAIASLHYHITTFKYLRHSYINPNWKQLVQLLDNHMETLSLLQRIDIVSLSPTHYNPGHRFRASRNKRGLFDFVGSIQSKLWGTATTQDLDDLVGRVKGILTSEGKSGKHLGKIVNLLDTKITGISSQIDLITKTISKTNNEIVNITKHSTRMIESIVDQIDASLTLEALKIVENFFLTLYDLSLTPNGYLIGGSILRLFSGILGYPRDLFSVDMINTFQLSMMYMDQDILFLQLTHYTSDPTSSKTHQLLKFEQTNVGVGGFQISLSNLPQFMVLDGSLVQGYLDPLCVQRGHHSWQVDHCPILPYNSSLHACYQEIISNETAVNCSLTLRSNLDPIQQTCTGEWLMDTEQSTCNDLSIHPHSLILVSFNTSQQCIINGLKTILPATQIIPTIKTIPPLFFLYHHLPDANLTQHYHPHAVAFQMDKIQNELMVQTNKWKHTQNLTDEELTNYIHLFSQDQKESSKYLSSLVWKKYHVSFWESLLTIAVPILSLYSTIVSSILLFLLLCRGVSADEIKLPSEIHYDGALLVADWVLITLILLYLAHKLMKRINRPYYIYPSMATLAAQHTLVSPGQMMVFITVSIDTFPHGIQYTRILVGGSYEPTVNLSEEAVFTIWSCVLVPPVWYRFQSHWVLLIHHSGIFSEEFRSFPSQKILTITLPHTIQIKKGSTAIVCGISTTHDMNL